MLTVNLRHLEAHGVHLEGELSVQELDIETHDEVIQLKQPLRYNLEIEKMEEGLLVRGDSHLRLDCQCVRCLKPCECRLDLEDWSALVPLKGEEAVPVSNDCVDLTPYVREDILLEFPQHPLCDQDCRGLPEAQDSKRQTAAGSLGAKSALPGPSWTN